MDVEVSILALRSAFAWGTARIQQGLYCLPEYVREAVQCVQNVRLSRTAINNVLKKQGLNGYKHDRKGWRFFRAEEPMSPKKPKSSDLLGLLILITSS